MIPATNGFLPQEIQIREQPSNTYRMDLNSQHIRGYIDNLEAMKQAVFKILNTERYLYVIYSWDYGIETLDLYGQDSDYVMVMLQNRITEALLQDTRIQSVNDFSFDVNRHSIHCTFVVHTIFGDFDAEKVVNI